MIISKHHNYIFVHIPKTGGTSLALALEARLGKDDICLGDTPKAVKRRHRWKGKLSQGRLWKHATLKDIPGLIDEAEIDAMRVFTVVRNPWDRIVSYYHWLRHQSFQHPAVDLARSVEFSPFINHVDTIRSFQANPYASYVTRSSGQEQCDVFLRLETIDLDSKQLEELLGLKLPPIPHVNKSGRGPYQDAYSARDRDLVAELCEPDINRFGYSF